MDGNAIFKNLGKLRPIWIQSTVADADEWGRFFREDQPWSLGKCLAVIIPDDAGLCVKIDDSGLFPRKDLRTAHRR